MDQHGKVLLHKSITRSKPLTTIANTPPKRIGVEACDGAHYWASTLRKLSMIPTSDETAIRDAQYVFAVSNGYSLHQQDVNAY